MNERILLLARLFKFMWEDQFVVSIDIIIYCNNKSGRKLLYILTISICSLCSVGIPRRTTTKNRQYFLGKVTCLYSLCTIWYLFWRDKYDLLRIYIFQAGKPSLTRKRQQRVVGSKNSDQFARLTIDGDSNIRLISSSSINCYHYYSHQSVVIALWPKNMIVVVFGNPITCTYPIDHRSASRPLPCEGILLFSLSRHPQSAEW